MQGEQTCTAQIQLTIHCGHPTAKMADSQWPRRAPPSQMTNYRFRGFVRVPVRAPHVFHKVFTGNDALGAHATYAFCSFLLASWRSVIPEFISCLLLLCSISIFSFLPESFMAEQLPQFSTFLCSFTCAPVIFLCARTLLHIACSLAHHRHCIEAYFFSEVAANWTVHL